MNDSRHTWALVLAAGEGSRLRSLTTTAEGVAVPKQFCSLRGGPSLLHEALDRASAVAPPERTCVIVARQHRRWWRDMLDSLPHPNIVVQPANRGTANGILLPLLHILRRDPEATVVLLPSDHHFGDETTLRDALQDAVMQSNAHPSSLVLLGLAPEEVDPELGYIVPGLSEGGLRRVERFVEKPSRELTRTLIDEGALWNAFIVVARARTIVHLIGKRFPALLADMRSAIAYDAGHQHGAPAIERLYHRLPDIDFSREVLQAFPERLRVLEVAACGWSDLGTPDRVARTLSRSHRCAQAYDAANLTHVLNLAEQHGLLHAVGQ